MTRFAVTALLCAGLLTGCKPDAAVQQSQVIGKGTRTPDQPAAPEGASTAPAYTGPSGKVSGTVSFTGKVPAKVLIDTSMDPACSIHAAAPVYSEQYAVTAGKLANIFIYVKTGPPAALQAGPITSQPVVLDQQNCQYLPHVVAVMAGSYVEFRNSDLTMHNIHTMPTTVGNQPIDVSQGPKGAPVTKQFLKPETMIPVRCNNHPWMNAFINVSATPYFAVTDAAGHFTLAGLPAGDYTLGAVHEKLGEKELHVTITANGTAKADTAFTMN